MTDLLAKAGETVHVIAHRWDGAPKAREESADGRLIVHRVALDEVPSDSGRLARPAGSEQVPQGLLASSFPSQAFSWQAAFLAERLIENDAIDIIEAQEWEAPLYYFQLRRALNLGPARRPPCVVHLHSPTEQIFAANHWDVRVADYAPAVALEEYSITNADALLCPSRFLAAQAIARYRIDPSLVNVIPYPLGDSWRVDRDADTWSAGSICHVGRLELRKGILEWVDAVAMVASDYPDMRVDFVGGDTPVDVTGGVSVGDAVRARVPRRIRRQFRFHGVRDRRGVLAVLSRARVAVVPSRWENFPYSCIESMSSGLPVLASPNGGMREMVDDGTSGWIAPDAGPAGLASALRRALETPASRLQQMGDAAAETIRRICDNDAIVARHLEVKRRVASTPARRPVHVAPSSDVAPSDVGSGFRRIAPPRRGIGVIVICPSDASPLDSCLSSIREQTEPPAAVCVICDRPTSLASTISSADGWQIVAPAQLRPDDVEMTAAWRMASGGQSLLGLAFIDSRMRLEPEFLARCATAFSEDDRLGIVSAWTHETAPKDRVRIQPNPGVPYLCGDKLITPYVAVRAEALEEIIRPSGAGPTTCARRTAFDRVMQSGWAALTYPAVLGTIAFDRDDPAAREEVVRYSTIARALQRLHTPILRWLLACSPEERLALLRQGLRSPRRSVQWLAERTLRGWRALPAGRQVEADSPHATRRS
jgi:glycosyltransferase involved in cell wall biosynthesis